ncbi:unnamed protein product [Microthlaspi erraticum]|uniref:RING-type E3 ubiquitin transferase n=1 Tax=Microthlaspi erraticum TaxID=1685480 RepID=A0A6D2ISJ2_9BRAS|nr:unnamed protein product [Microthlaspi erraticum]
MSIRTSDIVEVMITTVANLPRNLESTNTVKIYLHDVFREVVEDVRETVIHLRSSHIHLKPRGGFTSPHLYELLRYRSVPESRHLGQTIAHKINQRLANDNSLREPVFVTVNVNFIKEERWISLSPSTLHVSPPSKGASREVLQRLVKEQRVEPKDLDGKSETQCSICIVAFCKSRECIIELPECKHLFHEDCLFEWLARQNSCPLCRSVPNPF